MAKFKTYNYIAAPNSPQINIEIMKNYMIGYPLLAASPRILKIAILRPESIPSAII